MATGIAVAILILMVPLLAADQSLTDMFSYQLETCNYLSLCPSPANFTTQQDHGQHKSCCTACSCSADCRSEGSCCPASQPSNQSSQGTHDPIAEHTECLRSLLIPTTSKWTDPYSWYFMVSSCPDNSPDSAVSSRCLQRNKSNVDDVTPVYSSRTGRVYANQFCSMCHGERSRELRHWDTVLACRSHADIESEFKLNTSFINQERLTAKELLQHATVSLLSDDLSTCNIAYEPPPDLDLSHLQCLSQEAPETGKCVNVLVQRLNYEPFLKECALYSVAQGNEFPGVLMESVHKTVLCFVCVGRYNANANGCDLALTLTTDTPFTIILNYRDEVDVPTSKENICNDSEVYDPFKDMCRTAICPYFSGPPYCHFMPRMLYELSVKFHLRLVPPSTGPPLTLATTAGAISKVLKYVRDGLLQNDTNAFLSKVINIESWYKTFMRENVSIVDFIYITVGADASGPFFMKEMYTWLDKLTSQMSPLEVTGVKLYVEMDNRLYEEKLFRLSVSNVRYNGEELTRGGVLRETYFIGSSTHLLLNKFYFCRQVELGANEFQLIGHEIVVRLSEDVTVKLNDYHTITDRFGNNSVRVCVDDLLGIHSGTSDSAAQDSRPKLHIFPLVLCSILSLLLIIGYELKSERHKVAGERHSLALACYCIIVEISFGLAHQPFELSNFTFCPVVGLLNHFFGLHFIIWLSVCAYYSYRQSMAISHQSTRPLKYISLHIMFLSTGSLSGIFVSVSVFVSLMQSGATQIGYDNDSCFLTSLVMTISAFILPAGVFATFSIICLTAALNCLTRQSDEWRMERAGNLVYQRVIVLLLMALVCIVVVMLGVACLVFGHQWLKVVLETLIAGYGVLCLCVWLLAQTCSNLWHGQCVLFQK